MNTESRIAKALGQLRVSVPASSEAGTLLVTRITAMEHEKTYRPDALQDVIRQGLRVAVENDGALALPSGAIGRRAAGLIVTLAELVGYVPSSPAEAALLGHGCSAARRYGLAIQFYNRGIELGEDVENYSGMASALARLHRNAESLVASEHALRIRADDSEALGATALAHSQLGNREEELAACERWVATDRGHKSLENRAAALARLNRFEDAAADLSEVRELTPLEPCAIANHAAILQMMGRSSDAAGASADALRLLNQYLKNAPDDVLCLALRARVHVNAGSQNAALADYSRALRAAPGDPSILLARGWTYLGLGAGLRAMEDFQHSGIDLSADLDLRVGLAQAFVQQSRHEEALEVLRQEPEDSGRGDCVRGQALAGLGEHSRALACFERELRRDPTDFNALYRSAASLYALGRKEEAVDALAQSVSAHPDSEWARSYARRDPDLSRLRRDRETRAKVDAVLRQRFSLWRFLAETGFDPRTRR